MKRFGCGYCCHGEGWRGRGGKREGMKKGWEVAGVDYSLLIVDVDDDVDGGGGGDCGGERY